MRLRGIRNMSNISMWNRWVPIRTKIYGFTSCIMYTENRVHVRSNEVIYG